MWAGRPGTAALRSLEDPPGLRRAFSGGGGADAAGDGGIPPALGVIAAVLAGTARPAPASWPGGAGGRSGGPSCPTLPQPLMRSPFRDESPWVRGDPAPPAAGRLDPRVTR